MEDCGVSALADFGAVCKAVHPHGLRACAIIVIVPRRFNHSSSLLPGSILPMAYSYALINLYIRARSRIQTGDLRPNDRRLFQLGYAGYGGISRSAVYADLETHSVFLRGYCQHLGRFTLSVYRLITVCVFSALGRTFQPHAAQPSVGGLFP